MFTIIEDKRVNLDELVETLSHDKKNSQNLGNAQVKKEKMIIYLKKIQKFKQNSQIGTKNKNK